MRRILTALVLIPLVVGLVLWGPPYLLIAVQFAITEVALWEFFRLAERNGVQPLRIPGYAAGAAIGTAWVKTLFYGAAFQGRDVVLSTLEIVFSSVYWIFPLLLLAWALLSARELSGLLASVSCTLLGVLYVGMPLFLLVWLCL